MPTLAFIQPRQPYASLPPTGAGIGTAGRIYFASDTGHIFYDTGIAWVDVSAGLPTTAALIAAIQRQSYVWGVDSGAANAYVVATTPAMVPQAGSFMCFKALYANTGASTATVGSSTAAIVKQGTVVLAGAEIAAGQIVRVIYDGTNWQL